MKKLMLLIPLVVSLAGCSIFNPSRDTSNTSGDNSDNSQYNPSYNPDDSGLVPGGEETDPELKLLYDTFYDPSSDVKITINISDTHLQKMLNNGQPYDGDHNNPDNAKTHDIYSPCNITVKINDEIREFNEVGIRVKGNLSRKDVYECMSDGRFNGRLGLKLSFNTTFDDNPDYTPTAAAATLKARRFGKAKTFNLKYNRNLDENFVKEDYSYYIMREEGLLAMRTNNIKVVFKTETYTTNEFLYSAQENIDAQFLNKRLNKASQEGYLYKAAWKYNGSKINLRDSSENLFGVEDAPHLKFYTYDLKTKKNSPNNHTIIRNMINGLKANSGGKSQDELKVILNQYVDVDYLLKYMAMEWIISNPDSLRFNYNNTYFYFSSSNGKMYPIMYDNDRCFGVVNGWDARPFEKYPTSTKSVDGAWQENPLYWRMILKSSQSELGNLSNVYPCVEEYRNKYLDYIDEYATKYLNVTKFNQYKNTFRYTDNVSGGNLSFGDFVNAAKDQVEQCMHAESRR